MIEDKKLTLKIHLKDGTILDVTEAVTSITWSGDIKSPSRTLAFNIVQAVNDEEVETIGVREGDTVSFIEDTEEIFRGILIDVDKKSNSNEVIYTSKDIGFLLSKNKLSFNFKDKTPETVAKEVISKLGYKVGSLAKTGYKYNKIVTNSSGYDIIQSAYTERSGKTKKKYMTYAHKDMYYVIEKGEKVLELQFNEKENLTSTSYKISLENMVNKVVVTDSNGNKVSEEVDKETLDLYKITIQEIKNQTDKDSSGGDVELKKPEKTASLTGFGDTSCKCGRAVYVKDTATGLVGKFYIDTDKHTWKGGHYGIELGLNFENIMDEKAISDATATEDGVSVGGSTGGSAGGGNSKAVDIAKSKLGKPYKWGATGPNTFDCSGLVYWTAKQMGKTVPRTSRQQSTYGQAVSKSNLQPGDCVFFGSPVHHVGIYVGNGQYLHAPQTGDVVKISNLNSRKDYAGARRFL